VVAQGQFTRAQTRPRFLEYAPEAPGGLRTDGVSRLTDVHVLGRWTRSAATGALAQVQASHTAVYRTDALLESREWTTDIDAQYEVPEIARQAIVVGTGVRVLDLQTEDTLTLKLAPEHSSIFNAFVQDEISLARTLSMTVGAKAEYDGMAGWGVLPSARILWSVTPAQRVWGSVSRARRTPAATDRTLRFLTVANIPGTRVLVEHRGNPDYRNETLLAAEAGYRLRIGAARLELAVFEGTYDHLPTTEPLGAVFVPTPEPGFLFVAQQITNLMHVRTRGAEVNASWVPVAGWRLSGSYSLLNLTPRPDPASRDASALQFDGNAPQHQWQAHSAASLGQRWKFDLGIYRVGRLERLAVPAYTRLDTRIEFKLTDTLSVVAAGRNLLDRRHQEFSGARNAYVASSIPRSAHLALRWQF
jgi:iron complex outermembrane receptor protein